MTKSKLSFLIIIFGLSLCAQAQKNSEFSSIDFRISQVPDSLITSTSDIAKIINSNFTDQKEKAAAVFIWITNNIQYDTDNMFAIDFYQDSSRITDRVLLSRKGVCIHYAELFKEIANKVGIKSYVIHGFTKQRWMVDNFPHAWCAGLIDSTWFLFDPTWGSGFVENSIFYRHRDMNYFMASPNQFIKTHMPFDPLWQFSNYPITNQEFYDGKRHTNKDRIFFNYIDTLRNYEKQSEISRIEASIKRTQQNGIRNIMIFAELEDLTNKILFEKYNKAVYLYNEGIIQLNRSIDIWNQFNPDKNIDQMYQLLDSAGYSLNASRAELREIQNPKGIVALSIKQLNKSIDVVIGILFEQEAFLNRYLKYKKQ